MFFKLEVPILLEPGELDQKLSEGWFRSQNALYESHITFTDDKYWNSIKIRLCLGQWRSEESNQWQKIKKRNKRFRTEVLPLKLTPSHYELFDLYRLQRFEDTEGNLSLVLGGEDTIPTPSFPSKVINIFDGDQLIGSGIFDLGNESALGYLFYYDPSFQKFSIGKHLIYSMMEYCQQNGIRYFYPGYYLPGMPSMEYKLGIASEILEYLEIRTYTWKKWESFSAREMHLEIMHEKLTEKETHLHLKGYSCRIVYDEYYPYYPFAIACNSGWDAPFCLMAYNTDLIEKRFLAIGFDVRKESYVYFQINEDTAPQLFENGDEIYAIYSKPMTPLNDEL